MRLATFALAIVLFAALSHLDTSISHGNSTKSGKVDTESAVVALAGEFRTVFANLLWIKADHYHHEYEAHNADWTKDKDLLGLDRIITKLDPHFEEAYASGAIMLVSNNKSKEAGKWLEEAVTNNPNSMMLHDEYGTILARHLKDYASAEYQLKKAYCLADDDWDRARLKKLIRSVKEMSKTKPSGASNSPS